MRFQKAEEADQATVAKRLYAALKGLPPEVTGSQSPYAPQPGP